MANQTFAELEGEMAELLESFIVESTEIFDKLGPDLLELETNTENAELHNRIFRAVHTIKGTSSFLGIEQVTELAHNFEDVLNKIRRKELHPENQAHQAKKHSHKFLVSGRAIWLRQTSA